MELLESLSNLYKSCSRKCKGIIIWVIGTILAIDIDFFPKIFNSELFETLIKQFDTCEESLKIEILQLLLVIVDYKNYEFTFSLFDYDLLQSLINYMFDTNNFFKVNYLMIILDIIKNLFETELNFFGSLTNVNNFDENKIQFITKFIKKGGVEILEKIIYMQKEDITNQVNSIMKLIYTKEKIIKEIYKNPQN